MLVRRMVAIVGANYAARLTSKGWRCCVRRREMNTRRREVRSWMRSTLVGGWRMKTGGRSLARLFGPAKENRAP